MQQNASDCLEQKSVEHYFAKCLECIPEGDHLAFKRLCDEMSLDTFSSVLACKDDSNKDLSAHIEEHLGDSTESYLIVRATAEHPEIFEAASRFLGLTFMSHIIDTRSKKMAAGAY